MRITTPTSGVSRTRGRVAALLEVGTGFHPELTGRENVFLNAAILGMSRRETARRFDEIVAFAGTERFLDTPLKRYSSGMYLRLAFAVAAHLEPDILIVDEVLAVGDAEFQRRCIGRMSEAEREGRTVVFVSHDLASLRKLCSRAIWLESGEIRDDGPTEQVVRDYLTSGFSTARERQSGRAAGAVRLVDVQVTAKDRPPGTALLREDPLRVVVCFEVLEERMGLNLAVIITNSRGVRVFDESLHDNNDVRLTPGTYDIAVDVPSVLNVGEHTVGVWIGTATDDVLTELTAAAFTLHGETNRLDRAVVLDLPFTVSRR
jgi:ABC-2 type transport system ATP-binding protein/lipopolysaccharide transport system ATP-binding protein